MENKETNDLKSNENQALNNRVKNARKEGLTRGALTAGLIGFVVLIALGIYFYSRYTRDHNTQVAMMESQKTDFTQQLTVRDSMINDWLATFDEIEKNLTAIKQKENILSVQATDSEFSQAKKDKILEDIKSINSLIEENKKKIAQLNSQLKKSGTTITGLQTRIADLETMMQQHETEITDLKATLVNKDFKIEQLNTTVYALQDTLTRKDQKITDQTYKLNQAYVASGTYKDLKEKGLVYKEGGFLGLGRKENLIENFPDSLFREIDVTETKTIPVNSKSMKLITEHPSGSYQVVREGENMVSYIDIKDPGEFWKISKYAVVELVK